MPAISPTCVKHALLLDLLRAMQRKDKPFLVLDTHAGIGRYDLSSGPAEKTGEWRDGIGKLLAAKPEPLADYLALVERLGLYPGSPAIAAALLRPGDRLIACELHPEDAATLKQNFRERPAASPCMSATAMRRCGPSCRRPNGAD